MLSGGYGTELFYDLCCSAGSPAFPGCASVAQPETGLETYTYLQVFFKRKWWHK